MSSNKNLFEFKGITDVLEGITSDLRRKENLELAYDYLKRTLEDIATGEHYDEMPEKARYALKYAENLLREE